MPFYLFSLQATIIHEISSVVRLHESSGRLWSSNAIIHQTNNYSQLISLYVYVYVYVIPLSHLSLSVEIKLHKILAQNLEVNQEASVTNKLMTTDRENLCILTIFGDFMYCIC